MAKLESSYIFVIILLAVFEAEIGLCSVHSHGDGINFFSEVIYEGDLYDKNTSKPANYSIIFEYTAPSYHRNVEYYQINVTAKSQVIVDIENDAPNYGPKTVKIHMMIFNATDLKVHLLLKGIMRGITNIYFPFRIIKPQERQFKPKSLTVVYEHDPKESASKNRQITIGERQTDDKLLYVEQKRSTLDSRIANADFQFMNNSVFITSITFSFNSPSTIVFLNSSLIDTHQANAIMYDLNRPAFSANIAVFGYELQNLPNDYRKIVFVKTSLN